MTQSDGSGTTPDQPRATGAGRSGRPDGAAPRSVAEEAALLVDLLSRGSRAPGSGMPSRPAASDGRARGEGRSDAPSDAPSDAGPDSGPGECTCGGSRPAACRVCPVCQLIALVQQVNPDTIEKVADFVGFAATALRDLATAQRERRAEPGRDASTGTGSDTDTHTDRPGPGDHT